VRVNNFQTPKIQAVLSSLFRDGNDIAGGSNRGGGAKGGLNIGVKKQNKKTTESQRPSLGPYRTFLVLTALQIEYNRHRPTLRGLSSPPSTNAREP